jgi:hypothetical protein
MLLLRSSCRVSGVSDPYRSPRAITSAAGGLRRSAIVTPGAVSQRLENLERSGLIAAARSRRWPARRTRFGRSSSRLDPPAAGSSKVKPGTYPSSVDPGVRADTGGADRRAQGPRPPIASFTMTCGHVPT